jgi:metal-responsive CopG/Arc/MetJ family transcriptional regulator
MSRIVIDLPDEDLRLLDTIKDIHKKPRAAIIRIAISEYLASNRIDDEDGAFGVWHGENGDGLEFQTTMRKEWPQFDA